MLRVAVILSLAGSLALAARAEPMGFGPGPPPGPRLGRLVDELGLDPDTREEVCAILESSREEAEELRAALAQARRELGDLLAREPLDEAAVLRQVQRIGDAQTALRSHRLATLLRVRELLAPAQRERLRELWWERGPEFWGRRFDFGRGSRGAG